VSLSYLVRGLIMGFSIAAPVGPIGLLCVSRTLTLGRAYGLVSGLGAASADMVYGFIAAFGVTLVANALVTHQSWLRVGGGLFLVYLGVRAFISRPSGEGASPRAMGLAAAYLSTLFLTLTNPMTILAFAAVFSGVGLCAAATYSDAGCLVVGVFAGSSLWWLLLSGGVSLLRHRVTTGGLLWINRVSGAAIVAFGIAAIVLSRQG